MASLFKTLFIYLLQAARLLAPLNLILFYPMKNSNRLREPFIIVLTVVLLLTAFSFTDTEFKTFAFTAKKINLFSEVQFCHRDIPYPLPDLVFTDALRDSLAAQKRERERLAVRNFSNGRPGAMDTFYRSLLLTKKTGKKTRIAYFGDSMIEGDLLTMDLRSALQSAFGGNGVGFVPITSIVAGFRVTIIHGFSGDWLKYDFNNKGGTAHPLGPSGYVFVPSAGSWVKYTGPRAYGSFNMIKLYYGPGNEKAKVTVEKDGNISEFSLSGAGTVNEIILNESGSVHSIQISFHCSDDLNVYGLSFESGSGVCVDNYSYRGNAGLALTGIQSNVLNDFNNFFNYDLIVLHYGLNAVGHKVKDYSWYRKGLENTVDHIKAAFPHASIMIVSLGDKGYRENGEWSTEPDVPRVVELQQKVAEEKGLAFWNMYENMGGYNSMKSWVERDTVLANSDYTHLNHRGAKKIADILFSKLMEGYNDYKAKEE